MGGGARRLRGLRPTGNLNCDMYEAAHAGAPAVATASSAPGRTPAVFTYQGDGDLASIGTAEIVHAAHRGEKITTIFVNNAIYGMTGGQMPHHAGRPERTTTSPFGRDKDWCGSPISHERECWPPSKALPSSNAWRKQQRQHPKGQKGHPQGLPNARWRAAASHGGGLVHLPQPTGA